MFHTDIILYAAAQGFVTTLCDIFLEARETWSQACPLLVELRHWKHARTGSVRGASVGLATAF
jgi:hypothetical protein